MRRPLPSERIAACLPWGNPSAAPFATRDGQALVEPYVPACGCAGQRELTEEEWAFGGVLHVVPVWSVSVTHLQRCRREGVR